MTLSFPTPLPLTLYVHLPWCVRKCPYCDFNSHEWRQDLPEGAYVDALLRDLEQDLPRVWGRTVQTVFFGGGTPSLFSPATIERLLSGIRARVTLAPECEITLEANPGTVDTARFSGFREAGINRLSIGVQSFDPSKLKALGRIHGPDEAVRAAEAARMAGFDNFNLDVMFGLPRQTVEEAITDVRTAIGLKPTHISAYQLTIEPNTFFHAHRPALPDDDAIWAMQQRVQSLLARHGYHQYEVSAYAQTDRECRHNLNYWRFGDYLGIGAGAHAKLTHLKGITRLAKQRQPTAYLDTAGGAKSVVSEMNVSPSDAAFEFMLNALRLTKGFPPALFVERAGLPLSIVEKTLNEAEAKGLLAVDNALIRPTALGQRFLNDLTGLFLPVKPSA